LNQVAGAGTALAGASKAFGMANGGAVTRMAKGGLVKSKNSGLAALIVHSLG
jgi:hypothetical protein